MLGRRGGTSVNGSSVFRCAKALAQKHAMRYVVCGGVRLPFADGEFDTVLLLSVLHHAKSPEAVLAEAARVARHRVIVFEDIPHTL